MPFFPWTRIVLLSLVVALSWTGVVVRADSSNYDSYGYDDGYGGGDGGGDNLYHDYAARQEGKEMGANAAGAGGGGWGKVAVGTALGWFAGGKFHSRRASKKLNTKFKEDQKKLYQQYYNDVYSLQQQNQELMAALEQYSKGSGGGGGGRRM